MNLPPDRLKFNENARRTRHRSKLSIRDGSEGRSMSVQV